MQGGLVPRPWGVFTRVSYLLQQWRLLPYLAAAYALDHFSKSLFLDMVELQQGRLGKDASAGQVRARCLFSAAFMWLFTLAGAGRLEAAFLSKQLRLLVSRMRL